MSSYLLDTNAAIALMKGQAGVVPGSFLMGAPKNGAAAV